MRKTLTAAIAAAFVFAVGCGSTTNDANADRLVESQMAAPPDAAWTSLRGVQVPSGADGPRSGSGAERTGYARTPHGALLAALNAETAVSLASDSEWARVLTSMTVPGPGRDEYAAARALVSITGEAGASAPRWAGYRWISWDDKKASLEAVTETPDGELHARELRVQWMINPSAAEGETEGDWRLVLEPTGEAQPPRPVGSLDNYYAFSAEESAS
ncbi:hypothetical protein [Hoyosella altamirensis]|uniref:DUF8175 domain-containing protein n=1 Tax=Hoyosella altamirensis TaxID=616997 RepID=A0A839RUV4_9ACTN|nr:hypothetical protein [Hoyosella altamirensis]MBB3040087.1 hypothetical protein [Hoyosella altamirensis]